MLLCVLHTVTGVGAWSRCNLTLFYQEFSHMTAEIILFTLTERRRCKEVLTPSAAGWALGLFQCQN